MTFRDFCKRVRAAAAELELRSSMTTLNDAIAVACYGKRYSQAMAAEGVGKLPPIPAPAPFLMKAAREFHLDANLLGRALAAGFEGGAVQAGPRPRTVVDAVNWLAARYPAPMEALAHAELFGLVDRETFKQAMSSPEDAAMAQGAFREFIIAEGWLDLGGQRRRPDELLRERGAAEMDAGAREFLAALRGAPLRLYVIDSVQPGHSIRLREVGPATPTTVEVRECRASAPELQGEYLAARVIPVGDHYELPGGILSFTRGAGFDLAAKLRSPMPAAEMSRLLRTEWFRQFTRPPVQYVVAGDGEALRFITDTYRCRDLELLASRLATLDGLSGSRAHGWVVSVRERDGKARTMCSITVTGDGAEVEMFYDTAGRAERYRPRIEAAAGDCLEHRKRVSKDVDEAMADFDPKAARRRQPKIDPEDLSRLTEAAMREGYAAWADTPVPILDSITPRAMIARPGGESRVRDLLAFYEANERGLAARAGREPIDLGFLYAAVGLSRDAAAPPVPALARRILRPQDFAANDAWIVFRMLDKPARLAEGFVNGFGLMEARSTCILNFTIRPAAEADFGPRVAKEFLTQLRMVGPAPPPRRLLIAHSVASPGLTAAARKLGIDVAVVHDDDLLPLIGEARAVLGARVAQLGA